MQIVRADQSHVSEVAKLFDQYRQFYKCKPDIELANTFISDRINNQESIIFIAVEHSEIFGFVQLYPSFCSVDAVKIFILYDLYVDKSVRNSGIGASLMNRATEFARQQGAARLDLLTEHDNKAGQHLYESLGYKKVLADFYAYSLDV